MLALPVDEPDIDTIALFEDLFLLAVPSDDPRSDTSRIAAADIDQSRLILLEDGHCLRDQALAFCATAPRGRTTGGGGTVFGASSLNTVMQMVAGGYGVTLIPQIAADVERRDERVKFLRLENPQPGRSIGLVFRHTSPRKADFAALGEVVKESVDVGGASTGSSLRAKRSNPRS
jgi:LysR family hydrogen peroxide-inducible transcriptional activator